MKDVLNRKVRSLSYESALDETTKTGASHHDYSYYLTARNIAFSANSPYLIVGHYPQPTGWQIHISVVKAQMSASLDQILDFLIGAECTFAIPESSHAHGMILDGSFGYQEIGKVITIYPDSAEAALRTAEWLIAATAGFKGPDMPAGLHLGNCIYTSKTGDESRFGYQSAHDRNDWPFKTITGFKRPKHQKWVNKKYFKLQSLKNDAKGNVYKGLNFSKWTDISWCIIKQGKKHQCIDHAGRDIGDRLRWQYQVQTEVGGRVAVPKVIDLVEVSGDTYLIMEFIEGDSYDMLISSIQQGIAWYALSQTEQLLLTQLSLQVIQAVAGLHDLGYVHRDLSPVNFMVTPENKIVAIDIELSYHMIVQRPDPHFTLGTAGYMSPQQRAGKSPCLEDDIFGLGALLLRTFTGLSPVKFSLNQEPLFDQLNFFIRNRRLTALICSCLHRDPQSRPGLLAIAHDLELYHSLILTNNHLDASSVTASDSIDNSLLLTAAIQGLMMPPLLKDGKWYAKTKQEGVRIANTFKGYSWYPDFQVGASGIIYTLLIAGRLGYEPEDMSVLINSNYTLIRQFYERQGDDFNTGLYEGAAGFSVITAYMIKYGFLENNDEQFDQIARFSALPNPNLSLAEGIAGQGLAMMKSAELLDRADLAAQAAAIAGFLIRAQHRDGSWEIRKAAWNNRPVKPTGFLNGISGIAYFLMCYGFRYNDIKAQKAVAAALNWLLSQRKKYPAGLNFPVSSSNPTVDPWFENGFTGVAFLFIRAYALFKEERFKAAAYAALLTHPGEITSNYLSQEGGLSGLAEVYLEAWQVFDDPLWLKRTRAIIDFLNHTARRYDNGTICWLDGSSELAEPGFMNGQAGLIHLFLRYQNPGKVSFPLITL